MKQKYEYKGNIYTIDKETSIKLFGSWVDVVVYCCEYENKDGKYWVRPKLEFYSKFKKVQGKAEPKANSNPKSGDVYFLEKHGCGWIFRLNKHTEREWLTYSDHTPIDDHFCFDGGWSLETFSGARKATPQEEQQLIEQESKHGAYYSKPNNLMIKHGEYYAVGDYSPFVFTPNEIPSKKMCGEGYRISMGIFFDAKDDSCITEDIDRLQVREASDEEIRAFMRAKAKHERAKASNVEKEALGNQLREAKKELKELREAQTECQFKSHDINCNINDKVAEIDGLLDKLKEV